jgi:hypothetical protein
VFGHTVIALMALREASASLNYRERQLVVHARSNRRIIAQAQKLVHGGSLIP